MVILFLSIACVYFVFLLLVMLFWQRNEVIETTETFVSVIVVVRNEAEHIGALLTCLQQQRYPKDKIEFIVVNDNSTDDTLQLLQASSLHHLTVLQLPEGEASPKKRGIEMAVAKAKGLFLLFTDGDCLVDQDWAGSLVSYAIASKSDFVCGPVLYQEKNGWLGKVQCVEMFSLIGVTGASIKAGFPSMSNAANMLVRKSCFMEIGGYGNQRDVISGDDELLMHKLHKKGYKVDYFAHNKVIVRTSPNPTFTALLNQRRRWGSKWKRYELPYVKLLALFIFGTNACVVLGLLSAVVGVLPWHYFLEVMVVKAVMEYVMINQVANSLDEPKISKATFLFTFILYPFYVMTVGVLSNVKGFVWKGRRY